MEKQHIQILLLISSLFLLKPIADAKDSCLPASCGPNQPEVRFPFRIIDRQSPRCGFPGFDLSCDDQHQTILQLPTSPSYIVKRISYVDQVIYIDPEFCRPNRLVTVNIAYTPFLSRLWIQKFTFYNCSRNYGSLFPNIPFPCLSNGNYSVIALPADSLISVHMPSNLSCEIMTTIAVPVGLHSDIRDELELMWSNPYCRICEREGKVCRSKSDDGNGETICVSSSRGIPMSAKYGLGICIGVPAIICIIVFVRYSSSRVQGNNNDSNNNQGIDLSRLSFIRQPVSRTGLDGPTIESYPKIVFEDSCSLPNGDGTCAICLSDYKRKELLRIIPECNHYFHTECIDEWLKLNATCPVCRKTQKSSTLVTSCSNV